RVPATDPPPFGVDDGVRCVPVGKLATLEAPAAGFVSVGGRKTALDAICWLLDRGTDPDDITWIRPRDTWLLTRPYFQPGRARTFDRTVQQLDAMVASGRGDEREPHVGGRAAGPPRSDGAEDGGEAPALPARGHAPYAVRLPARGVGRHPHGAGLAGRARSAGLDRSLAAQPLDRLGRRRGPGSSPRAAGPLLRRAVPRPRPAPDVRSTRDAAG